MAVFIAGYILITLEQRYQVHRAITAAALGASVWLVIALKEGAAVRAATEKAGAEIFALVLFLLSAMTLVEILLHYRFFDWLRVKLLGLGLGDYGQLWVVGLAAFWLSAVIDNLTATLVTLTIVHRSFRGKSLLIAVSTVVVAANAGGAWSPIGDVSTIMLWLARKFTAVEIIAWGFLPSVVLFLVSTWMLGRGMRSGRRELAEEAVQFSWSDKIVIGVALGSFSLPLVFSRIGLQPYFGLVFGLGMVGILISTFRLAVVRSLHLRSVTEEFLDKADDSQRKHLTADIEKHLTRADVASLLFFTGILLGVSGLEHRGILDLLSHLLLGEDPSLGRFIGGTAALGVLSAIVDNIPLTAAAIGILKTTDPAIWSLLALAVGAGGSLLVIGSAAGVVAMGRIRELTFFAYLRIAMLPAAAGYAAAFLVWWFQYLVVR
jgi:Na+/H+ antiporter NhaD/arsenite permease-like protein